MPDKEDFVTTPISRLLDRIVTWSAHVLAWGGLFLMLSIVLQVTLRYGFGWGLVVLEEVQWHLYAIGIMFGASYAVVQNRHVRLDLIHVNLSPKKKAVIEILGIVFLLAPFLYMMIDQSLPFVAESWRLGERSDAPSGLPYRWAIKAIIPLGFSLLALVSFGRLTRAVATLFAKGGSNDA